MNRFLFAFCLLMNSLLLFAEDPDFLSPVNIPIILNGNFGELRGNHFHSGIDIKTNSEIGLPVSVIGDGYISRIGVSPTGYGNVLYVTHPNGYTSVYGHLEKFLPYVQKWVRSEQYRLKSFTVNLHPDENQFQVKRGEQIGFSGNSGSSGGPHLHFEVRKTRTEHPVNPLLLGYQIADTRKPVVENLFVYPLSGESHVEGSFFKKKFPLVFYEGAYRLKGQASIDGFGKLGFGVDAIDYLDGSWSKCGIYKLEMWIDGKIALSFSFSELDYSTMRCLNSHIDYDEYIRGKRRIHKTFIEPGNKLDIYNNRQHINGFNFDDGKLHEVRIVLFDVPGNYSEISFSVQSGERMKAPVKEFNKSFSFDQDNRFETEDVDLFIPKGALFTNIDFCYDKLPGDSKTCSPIYMIHNKYTPLCDPVSISIHANGVKENLQGKALLALFNPDDGSFSSIGGSCKEGWVTAKSTVFGNFCIMVDTLSPVITPLSIRNKSELIEKDRIRFRIKDELSGIKSYVGTIDGNWVLFEYDLKKNLIIYQFDDIFRRGESHVLNLRVEDNKGNVTEYSARFYY